MLGALLDLQTSCNGYVVPCGFTAYRLGTTDPSHASSSGVDDVFGEEVGIRSCVFGLVIQSDRYRYCCLHAVSTC